MVECHLRCRVPHTRTVLPGLAVEVGVSGRGWGRKSPWNETSRALGEISFPGAGPNSPFMGDSPDFRSGDLWARGRVDMSVGVDETRPGPTSWVVGRRDGLRPSSEVSGLRSAPRLRTTGRLASVVLWCCVGDAPVGPLPRVD